MSEPATPVACLHFDVDDAGVATITIDNVARMNAMSAAMWGALPGLIAKAESNPAVRVVMMRGAGTRAFSAGADISEFDTQRSGDAVHTYDTLNHNAFDALTNCAKPTIAMIHGFCLGGGLGLALACDLRVADEASTFAIPAAKLGIGYNPRWIGPILRAVSPATAKLILFTGRRFNATEALAMGLVTSLSRTDDLFVAAHMLASEIAGNAPLSVAAAKAMVDELALRPGTADLAKLDHFIAACFDSQDYAEGRRAFLEKRKPVFKGV
jgi:enoyl-CoA hydratase